MHLGLADRPGQSSEKLRLNPRKSWYRNLKEVTTNGDYEVTFHLQRPQPAFIALLASGSAKISRDWPPMLLLSGPVLLWTSYAPLALCGNLAWQARQKGEGI